jgi:hypothetical protein
MPNTKRTPKGHPGQERVNRITPPPLSSTAACWTGGKQRLPATRASGQVMLSAPSFDAATMPLVLRQPRTDHARRDAPCPGPLDGNGPSCQILASFRGGPRGAAVQRQRFPWRRWQSLPQMVIPKFLTALDTTACPASSSGWRGCGGDPWPRRQWRTTGVLPTSSSGAT